MLEHNKFLRLDDIDASLRILCSIILGNNIPKLSEYDNMSYNQIVNYQDKNQ